MSSFHGHADATGKSRLVRHELIEVIVRMDGIECRDGGLGARKQSGERRGLGRLRKLAGIAGDQFKMGILLYDGSETMPLGDRIWAAPLSTLWGTSI